jgi:hypothetical protein
MSRLVATLGLAAGALVGASGGAIGALGIGAASAAAQPAPANPVLALLDAGQVVFGSMAANNRATWSGALAKAFA